MKTREILGQRLAARSKLLSEMRSRWSKITAPPSSVSPHQIRLLESIAYELATPNGVMIIDDIRPILWKRAASLKARHKNLALGDCITIALAESLAADILTGDRDFQNVDTNSNIMMFR